MLDTNIYVDIEKAGLANAVRSFLDSAGCCVEASVVNLVELANAAETDQALRQVRTLTLVAREFEHPPFTLLMSQEFLAEVRRLRPRWLAAHPKTVHADVRLSSWQRKWNRICADPAIALENRAAFFATQKPLDDAIEREQRELLKLRRDPNVLSVRLEMPDDLRAQLGVDVLQRVDSLSELVRDTRIWALEDWRMALASTGGPNDLNEWTRPYLRRTPAIREVELAEFWLGEANLRSTPLHFARAALRRAQPDYRISSANRRDLDQASFLVRSHAVLTADKRFYSALQDARQELRDAGFGDELARVARVLPHQGSALEALRSALDDVL